MRIAHYIPETTAEGPGPRFALWTMGCSLHCPGCCNPELFNGGGTEYSVDSLLSLIHNTPNIEGVSLLGGEPTEQPDLIELCQGIQALQLTVMLYSGHTRSQIEARHPQLLESVDLLVDGRYVERLAHSSRRWIGSSNQVLHFLSPAYKPSDPRFSEPNTIELRLSTEGLVINGWPGSTDRILR